MKLYGAQPDGTYTLTYFCEGLTTDVSSVKAQNGYTNITVSSTTGMIAGDYIRFGTNYYKIKSVDSSTKLTLTASFSGKTGTYYSAEYGVFYSDPSVTGGVSSACKSAYNYTTSSMYTYTLDVATKLMSLSNVDATSGAVVSTFSKLDVNSEKVGYKWKITFNRQPGNLKTMSCDASSMVSTYDNSTANCTVTTLQEGSLISGYFYVSTTYPHEYEGNISTYNSTAIRWSEDSSDLATLLENEVNYQGEKVFGSMTVVRSYYTSGTRWSGGYTWTLTFTSRSGNVPALGVHTNGTLVNSTVSDLTNPNGASSNSTVYLEVSDAKSGSCDTFQGSSNYHYFSKSDPATAVDGNQICGTYGLTFDTNSTTGISVQNSTTYEALSADDFKTLFVNKLLGNIDGIDVLRSSSPTSAMGYTYTITFTGYNVGGDLALMGKSTSSLSGTSAGIAITEKVKGTSLRGAFQLKFGDSVTGSINYNAEASVVQAQLNGLSSISPSQVVVTRDGPLALGARLSGGTQVEGYVWSITFASNMWVDPTKDHHNSSLVPGNWYGSKTTWDAVWPSGYSKAWGKNVGDVPLMTCISTSLYTTNGALPSYGCSVNEEIKGTGPLSGTFTVELNTTNHAVINKQGVYTSAAIRHNAFATAVESGGDGTSLQEILQSMPNIGNVSVSRSAVNLNGNNGGYSWTVTFLRDADASGGQFGGCEQKSSDGLCNSPGDVPVFSSANVTDLLGSCKSGTSYSCNLVTLMDANNLTYVPSGRNERQIIYVGDRNFAGWSNESYNIEFHNKVSSCVNWNATASEIQTIFQGWGYDVNVTRGTSISNAPDGYFYLIEFFDQGNVPDPYESKGLYFNTKNSSCVSFSGTQNVTAEVLTEGKFSVVNCTEAGCKDGVVLRGNFSKFEVDGDDFGNAKLLWNAKASQVKAWLESGGTRVVDVSREVIGKYGKVSYTIRFVNNDNQIPPGSGDIALLNVTQKADTAGNVTEPVVVTLQDGSDSISGYYYIDYYSPYGRRIVDSTESPDRLKLKLEEFTTVGSVDVRRFKYPSNETGGWGDMPVDGVTGGYEYRIRFLRNPGIYDGFTFPPGSGNVDPVIVEYDSNLVGKAKLVTKLQGSYPLMGTFKLGFNGSYTYSIDYDQQAEDVEFALDQLPNIGSVSVFADYRLMQEIPGVVATVSRDATVAYLSYDANDTTILEHLTYGDYVRIGGANGTGASGEFVGGDGSIGVAYVSVVSGSPIVTIDSLIESYTPSVDEGVYIGGLNYNINKTGIEVQLLYISASSVNSTQQFALSFDHSAQNRSTSCLSLNASASTVQSALNSLSNTGSGSIEVTRTGSGVHGDPHLYRIYFSGISVQGDVNQLVVLNSCIAHTANIGVRTLVEGGYTEIQQLSLAVDSGYIKGSFYRLGYNSTSNHSVTGCIEWGADADSVQSAINGLHSLSLTKLPVKINTATSNGSIDVYLSTGYYADGVIFVGDRLFLQDSTKVFTVSSVGSNGSWFQVSSTLLVNYTHTSADIYVVNDAVRVRRSEIGNPKPQIISIRSTANGVVVTNSSTGYYRLRINVESSSYTTSCIAFDASAADMQTAINDLNIDWNANNAVDDDDYIIVTRVGDASTLYGYGYVYNLEFSGLNDTTSLSSTLGSSAPTVYVVDQGSEYGCEDVSGIRSKLDITATTTNDSVVVQMSDNFMTYLQAGDRIIIESSWDPYKVYTVAVTWTSGSKYYLNLTETFEGRHTGSSKSIHKLESGYVTYVVKTTQTGRSSYLYDIYFTSPHLSNVDELQVFDMGVGKCVESSSLGTNEWYQYEGMSKFVSLSTMQDGGSYDVDVITLKSSSMITSTSKKFYKLFYDYSTASSCLAWSTPATTIESFLSTSIGYIDQVTVTRSGLGRAFDAFGYTYSITYSGAKVTGDNPRLLVGVNNDTSNVVFVGTGENDLHFSGSYNASDIIVTVKMINSTFFTWYSSSGLKSSTNLTVVADTLYTIDHYNISMYFDSDSGHVAGDKWYIALVSSCGYDLPSGASIVSSRVKSAVEDISQITLSDSYLGEADRTEILYQEPSIFRVLGPTFEIQRIILKDLVSGFANSNSSYRIGYNSTYTRCLNVSASEDQVEYVLNLLFDCSNCIMVTRTNNSDVAPNGYIYSIYFNGEDIADTDISTLTISNTSCNVGVGKYYGEEIYVETIRDGFSGSLFRADQIPLASISDETVAARFIGASQSSAKLFKISGNYWNIKFDTNLGNLPALDVDSSSMSKGATVTSYGDFVKGQNPQSYTVSDVITGVPYYVRVKSRTVEGFSDASSTVSTNPSQNPPAPLEVTSGESLNINEVQLVSVGAVHRSEVQVVSTTADFISEVQQVTISTFDDGSISGNFSIRFPEVQLIKIKAGSAISSGKYKLSFTLANTTTSTSGQIKYTTVNTTCISYNADASSLQTALEDLSLIASGDVVVSRTGTGGYSSEYGYTYTVRFVGNDVAGNVESLRVYYDSCTSFSCATDDAEVTVSTVNDGLAMGTDTAIQVVQVGANAKISEGQYKLSVTLANQTKTTSCIDWNVAASDLETALESLTNVDSVAVYRSGDGGSQSIYGYTYSVFFDGNYMQQAGTVPIMSITNTGCTAFSSVVDNVMTAFNGSDSLSVWYNVTLIDEGGFDLSAVNASATLINDELSLLPFIQGTSMTLTSLYDTEKGRTFSILYSMEDGDLVEVTCSGDITFLSSDADCTSETLINGNQISGSFVLENVEFAFDATADEIKSGLEAITDFGEVSVSRSGPTEVLGYSWTITFIGQGGNLNSMTVENLLDGAGTSVTISEYVAGNQLGGTFQLLYLDEVTDSIPYDADDSVVKSALESLSSVGMVNVSSSGVSSSEGGRSWYVTFRSILGDVQNMIGNSAGLTGDGAAVSVIESIKGAEAIGNSVWISFQAPLACSSSQVRLGECGSPVTQYTVDISTNKGFLGNTQTKSIPHSPDYQIQYIRTVSETLIDTPFEQEQVTGDFKLSYNGEITAVMNSAVSAIDLRVALENLDSIDTVFVTRDYSRYLMSGTLTVAYGDWDVYCTTTCSFDSLYPSDLVYVGGSWYRVYSGWIRGSSKLTLGLVSDSSVKIGYYGNDTVGIEWYRWARGYEWVITFLKVSTDRFLPVGSPPHNLSPSDAAIEVRAIDCDKCFYINGLTTWTPYYLRVKAFNVRGTSPYSSTVRSVPKAIPSSPTKVSVNVVSGSQIEVFFSPPDGLENITDITSYTVQWSTSEDFSTYTSATVSGSDITGTPPYSYLIESLTISELYYIRVAARNSVPVQKVNPNGNPPDNTNWSGTYSATPAKQVPGAPNSVEVNGMGSTSLQLIISPPNRNGGSSITEYLIEWDSSASFKSSNYGYLNVSVSDFATLDSDYLVYKLSPSSPSLTSGVPYYVRVAAVNAIGTSKKTSSPFPVAPSAAPDTPSSIVVSSLSESTQPITEVSVTWDIPTSDNGAPIQGYLIEWWAAELSRPEVQLIRLTCDTQFYLKFSPQPGVAYSTASMNLTEMADDVRDNLINLGYMNKKPYEHHFVIGNVEVTRSKIASGYEWFVTFLDEDLNPGNQVELYPKVTSGSSSCIDVTEVQSGIRVGGNSEVQIINMTSPEGWFRLSMTNSSVYTIYLPAEVSADEMETALELLDTVNQISVSLVNSSSIFCYYVTFLSNIGNVPSLIIDASSLTSGSVIIYDGDNALASSTYSKSSYSVIGEAPVSYSSAFVSTNVLAYTIEGLTPGVSYAVRVSAKNQHGYGPRSYSSTTKSITPPQQIPQPPTSVLVDVDTGSSDTLAVTWQAPLSDGGSDITKYRVELDLSDEFTSPIAEEFYCPNNPTLTVWEVETTSDYTISGGYFSLDVSFNGYTYTTEDIPYDAVASASDESGLKYTFTDTEAFTYVAINGTYFLKTSTSVTTIIFPGDVLLLENSTYSNQTYTVSSVNSSGITLASEYIGDHVTAGTLYRLYGGRGGTTNSKVFCTFSSSACSIDRRRISGSMEKKISYSTGWYDLPVTVSRTGPNSLNQFIWRITFLDDPPSDDYDFSVSLKSSSITTSNSSSSGNVTVSQLVDGSSYVNCTGTFVVPSTVGSMITSTSSGGLVKGQEYYARVMAINSMGYSLPQTAISPQKPQVVPGAPTSVTLQVSSSTELEVSFNAPTDNGGDSITAYKVEYSIYSNFSNAQESLVTNLAGGAPFYKTLSGLTTGVYYYVRVSAMNSQGFGATQLSTPSKLNPRTTPSAPTNVYFGITSNTMITVQFNSPASDGGDTVQSYYVEWDTSSSFSSLSQYPNKGSVTVASSSNSYTLQTLTSGQYYYVRVRAINSEGSGTSQTAVSVLSSSQTIAIPSLQVPGKPHTVVATTGSTSGQLIVTWQRPRVPNHGIPCSGTTSSPDDCPVAFGSTLAASDGGSSITEYEVEFNERSDFTGADSGRETTTNLKYTLKNLTPGRTYYIRVLARNARGAGEFCAHTGSICSSSSSVVSAVARSSSS